MTVKEFYEYCCSKGFENCEIHITYNQTRYPYPMFMNTGLTKNDIFSIIWKTMMIHGYKLMLFIK